MRKLAIFLILVTGYSLHALGDDLVYPYFLIPDTLSENANAVIRNMETSLTIQSDNKAEYNVRKAVTILSEKGDDYAVFVAFYDEQRKISDISIRLYDAFGRLTERVKQDKIMDYSAVSGYSLYEDDRVLVYEPIVKTYPYTVVMEYTINYNGYIQFPDWQPQVSNDVSVQQASFDVRLKHDSNIRWVQRNMEKKPDTLESGNEIVVNWQVRGIPAFRQVAFMPPLEEITPRVSVSPLIFSLDGYQGSFRSWEEFGYWIGSLFENRKELPEETMEKVRALVAGSADTTEMVRRVYHYVQQRTRYVSIQLGIGGFQPFEASVVDAVGYGDCKALTNYTSALLRCAGIGSLYTVINAGTYADDLSVGFPSQQFNHVILQVPLTRDTIWLECTNQDNPFGYLGKFTADRMALAVTDRGGELVRTKRYDRNTDFTSTVSVFDIDENGNGSGSIRITCSGLDYDGLFSVVHQDGESQKKWLYEKVYIPNSRIDAYTLEELPGTIPQAILTIDLSLSRYAVKSGKRLFVPLNMIDAREGLPPEQEERKLDIHVRHAVNETDTIEFSLPAGYSIEQLPAPVEIKGRFGEYAAGVELSGDKVVYVRKLEIRKGTYPPEFYDEVCNFYKTMVMADNAKLVLKIDE